MSGDSFLPDIKFRNEAKQFNLGFIRPDNLVPRGFHLFCTEERLLSSHSAIKPRLVEGFSDGCPSGTLSHLPTLELSQNDHPVLGHLS